MYETENDLLAALQRNEDKAFKELYRIAYKKVENLILSNSGNMEDARDIFQDSIIVLIKMINKPTFKLISKISTLIYSINRNLWRKYIRDKMGKEINIMDDEDSNFVLLSDYEEELQEKKEVEKKHIRISEKLEEMSDSCKKIIKLTYFNKLSQKEIAETMGYSQGFVRVKLFRSMGMLREAVINY